MKKFDVLKCVICLLLVCCILFNISPIKAEAMVVEGAVVGALGVGLAALLILSAFGVVYTPTSQAGIQAIGQDMMDYLYSQGSSAEVVDEIEAFASGLKIVGGGTPSGDDIDNLKKIAVSTVLGGMLTSWALAFMVDNRTVEVENYDAQGEISNGYGVLTSAGTYTVAPGLTYVLSHDAYVFNFYFEFSSTLDVLGTVYISSQPFTVSYSSSSGSGTYSSSLVESGVYFHYSLCGSYHPTQISSYKAGRYVADYNTYSQKGGDLALQYFYEHIHTELPEMAPGAMVGDIVEGIENGTLAPEEVTVGDIDYSSIVTSPETAQQEILDALKDLKEGTVTWGDYVVIINPSIYGPEQDPDDPDPTEPVILPPDVPDIDNPDDPDTPDTPDTPSDGEEIDRTFLQDFLKSVYDFFDGLWAKLFEFWDNTLASIEAGTFWENLITTFETYIVNPLTSIWDNTVASIQAGTFWETLGETILSPLQWLADHLLSGISSLFFPSQDFLTAKVEALLERFSFLRSIVDSGKAIGESLSGIDTEPPIIYVELDDSTGKYDYGERAVVLDMRWYADYKPTVDAILSAVFWALFCWRMFIHAPNIISGVASNVGHVVTSYQRDINRRQK